MYSRRKFSDLSIATWPYMWVQKFLQNKSFLNIPHPQNKQNLCQAPYISWQARPQSWLEKVLFLFSGNHIHISFCTFSNFTVKPKDFCGLLLGIPQNAVLPSQINCLLWNQSSTQIVQWCAMSKVRRNIHYTGTNQSPIPSEGNEFICNFALCLYISFWLLTPHFKEQMIPSTGRL